MKKTIYLDDIPTNYYITSKGEVINSNTNKKLQGTITTHGYRRIMFSINGKKIGKYLHRLMGIYFLNFDENSDMIINHIDGNKLNNNLSNLEILSKSENNLHAYKNNLRKPNNKKCDLYIEDLENEKWIDILYYENEYQVSNYGRIKSLKYKKPIILRQSIRCGYPSVVLSQNGKTKHYCVHDLVYCNFNKTSKPENWVIDHIDGNKNNNKLDNLRCISRSDNSLEAIYTQKVNSVCKPVKAFKNGKLIKEFPSIAQASKELSVDNSCISKICRGKLKTIHGYTFCYSE